MANSYDYKAGLVPMEEKYVPPTKWKKLARDIIRDKYLILMLLPWCLYYFLFQYVPSIGIVIAFKDYDAIQGLLGSPWAKPYGLGHFIQFVSDPNFFKLLRNTVLISLYGLLWGKPTTITFALLLNEIKNVQYKKVIQTLTYVPHFIAQAVLCGIVANFLSTTGLFNYILVDVLHVIPEPIYFLGDPKYFRTIHIGSGMWAGIGFGTIVYLASIAGIDQELYEACTIDGGGRLAQAWYITLPSLVPTIIVLLILDAGKMLGVGAEKVLLLYNPLIYETADVLKTYIYRIGIQQGQFSSGAAVGMFESLIGVILITGANALARKYSEFSLW